MGFPISRQLNPWRSGNGISFLMASAALPRLATGLMRVAVQSPTLHLQHPRTPEQSWHSFVGRLDIEGFGIPLHILTTYGAQDVLAKLLERFWLQTPRINAGMGRNHITIPHLSEAHAKHLNHLLEKHYGDGAGRTVPKNIIYEQIYNRTELLKRTTDFHSAIQKMALPAEVEEHLFHGMLKYHNRIRNSAILTFTLAIFGSALISGFALQSFHDNVIRKHFMPWLLDKLHIPHNGQPNPYPVPETQHNAPNSWQTTLPGETFAGQSKTLSYSPAFMAAAPFTSSPSLSATPNRLRTQPRFGSGPFAAMDLFRDNAFVASSLITVLSRIYVSNRTARLNEHTPEAATCYTQAVMTFFRESLGFVLSYLLLKRMSNWTSEFFRTFLRTHQSHKSLPTLFTRLFEHIFKSNKIHWPSPWQAIKLVAGGIKDVIWDGPAHLFKMMTRADHQSAAKAFEHRFAKPIAPFSYDSARLNTPIFGKPVLSKLVDGTYWLLNKFKSPKGVDEATKVELFSDMGPHLLAAVPTILLSGYALERFSRDHATQLAQAIARHHSVTTPIENTRRTEKPIAPIDFKPPADPLLQQTSAIDAAPPLAYARPNFNPYFVPSPATNNWPMPRNPNYGYPQQTAQPIVYPGYPLANYDTATPNGSSAVS